MASFSFQHHPILLDSAPMAITSSGLSSSQHIINQEIAFSHLHYPTAKLSDELSHNGFPFHESTVFNKLESSGDDERVIQKLPFPVEKKRKGINGISSNSSESKAARGKKQNCGKNNGSIVKDKYLGQKEPPTPSGFIQARARRGQATNSHSLAERVRREKVSERMKMLQRLVPGAEKVIKKTLVLDEIIKYVQSLQNQVQFLSMKLASLNPLFYDSFLMRPEGLENNTNSCTTHRDNNPNAFSLENERQCFENASGFTNLCSFH